MRVPAHAIARELIRRVGGAVTGTSANVTGGPACRDAEDVRRQLRDEVDFVLDGGPTPGGLESTVVDLTGRAPRILREGAVSRAAIEDIVGPVVSPG